MYLLNMVFKIKSNKPDGQFSGDDDTTGSGIPKPLRTSLNWLELDPSQDENAPDFDPETARWKDLGQAGALYLPSEPDPGSICIRLMQHQGEPVTITKIQMAVSFGRPVRAHQDQASPFTHDGTSNGRVVTTFIPNLMLRRNTTSRGWFYKLGKIAIRPTHQKLIHRYEFSVGLIVTIEGGDKYYFGEDPEMDVGI